MKKKKVRVTVDLNEKDYQRLQQLAEIVGADIKAEVIRDALRLFEYLAKQHDEGFSFQQTKDGETVRVPLFALV